MLHNFAATRSHVTHVGVYPNPKIILITYFFDLQQVNGVIRTCSIYAPRAFPAHTANIHCGMEAGSVVRAMFDFCPSVSEELTLFAGDVIEVLNVIDEFWLLGNKEGITGQFPVSFVETLTIPTIKPGEKMYVSISDFTSHEPGALCLQKGDLVVLEGSLASSWLQGRNCWGARGFFPLSCVQEFFLSSRSRQLCQNVTVELPSYAIGQAQAIMGLSAQLDEELDFREGDIIIITGVPEPGWFEGELNGRRGIFPEGFVELLNPLRVHPRIESDHGLPSDKEREDFVLDRSPEIINERDMDKIIEDEEPEGTFAVALYRFQAMEHRELDFDVGDRIRIIRTLEDGWLEGELYGNRGIFPYRFVKIETKEKNYLVEQPVDSETSIWNPPVNYLDMSSTHEVSGTDPHYWDVHMENQPSSSTTQEAMQSPEATINTNQEAKQSHHETIYSSSTKPQLPPRPQSRAYSPPVSQNQEQRPKEKNMFTTQVDNRRSRTSLSNGAQEKWSSKKSLSLMTTDDIYSADDRANERSKNKNNRKNSLPLQDIVHWVEDHRRKPKTNSKEKCDTSSSRPSLWTTDWESPANDNTRPDLIDLDSKLTEQLSQFEKSLSNPNNKVSRHFSILDYNSEIDIIRGSPPLSKHQKSTAKFKVLRPPPPRPNPRPSSSSKSNSSRNYIPKSSSASSYLSPNQNPHRNEYVESTPPTLALRPSRPAPLPPPNSQRNTPSPKPLPRQDTTPSDNFLLSDIPDPMDAPDDLEQVDRGSPCPFLLLKIEDVERELEVYRNTREELCQMLEDEDQDEVTRAETIENLDFCDSNIESLNLELQQLKDMTLLSSQPEALEESPSAASTAENSEMRMLEKRSKVIEELLQTERDYLRDLETCVEHIMLPLQATQMTNVDYDVLFGNIHSVINVTTMFLGALENCDSVGLIFLEHRMPLELVYKEYCQNHEETLALLEAYEKNEKFQRSLQECIATVKSLYQEWGRTNYINLGSFLIKPVQRIMRYPLLLMELQGATPESHPDKNPIKEAVRAAKEINVNINEYKRRKDLVVKYRKGDEESLIDKIYKLNIHSIIKKSNRVSSHLKHLTGLSPQIKDEAFEETEKNFRMQERLIKSFIRDLSVYLQHIRESACVKVLAAMSMWDLYTEKGTSDLEKFQKAHRHISEKLFAEFKERTEKLVISPLNQLLTMFAGPHKLVQKRFDKLLDYHNCTERAEKLKDKKTLDELQSARNNYEALNAQLLDELPKFHNYAKELFANCVRGYANAHCDFVKLALEELKPLLSLLGIGGREGNLIALFQEEHSKVLEQLQVFTFFPENPPPAKKPFERKTIERQSARKTVPSPAKYIPQLDEHRTLLLARYPPEKLYQAERNFNAAQDLDVCVQEGDLVGVIKQQDPMGSPNRWLVDNGVTKGFVYSSFLRPYNTRHSHSDASIGSHSSTESGYGGSSPNFSRQNSNSTLTINPSIGSVSFTNPSTARSSMESSGPSSGLLDTNVPSKSSFTVEMASKRFSETDSGPLPRIMEKENMITTDCAEQSDSSRRGSQTENGSVSTLQNSGDKGLNAANRKPYRKKTPSPMGSDVEPEGGVLRSLLI
ncbi:dynamin-binding protein-like isoform X3 [Bufo gargarizans]|uniref:dynamin-binding protein-like isoform X3 n=1 Tax=Bufo gargarizans TaxID=30331 RepID=UPI001CF3A0C8|nr:dynamin-binding protein-like isoform X3 [Bufo gargarizans]